MKFKTNEGKASKICNFMLIVMLIAAVFVLISVMVKTSKMNVIDKTSAPTHISPSEFR